MASSNCVWKVKVFHQNQEGDWQDIGVGYLEFEENSVLVVSEDDPRKTILSYKVSQESYQKQGETILTWVSESGQSFALSFTDKPSLSQFFSEICIVQGRTNEELESEEDLSEIPSLPSPSLDNLFDILYILSYCPCQKLVFGILESNFVSKLGQIIEKLNKEDKEKLGMVFVIYKFLVLSQSREMLDLLIDPEEFPKVLDGLSYDPTLNGISYDLNGIYTQSKFNNLLGVNQQIRKKIEKLNKIAFLKETALGRHIDEQGSAFLMICIQEIWNEVLKDLISTPQVLADLTEKMKGKDLLAFACFKEISVMAKALNLHDRGGLFIIFFNAGILSILEDLDNCQQKDLIVEYLAEYISGLAETLPEQLKILLLPKESTFLTNLTKLFMSSSSISAIQVLSKLIQQLLCPGTPFSCQAKDHFNSTISSTLLSSLSIVSEEHQSEILSIYSDFLKNYPEATVKLVTSSQLLTDFKTLTVSNRLLIIDVLKLLSFLSLRRNRQIDLWLVRCQMIDFVVECLENNFSSENLIFSAALHVLNTFQEASSLVLVHLKTQHFKKLREMKLHQLVKKLQAGLDKAQENDSFFIKFLQDEEDFLEICQKVEEKNEGKQAMENECDKRKSVEHFKTEKKVFNGNS